MDPSASRRPSGGAPRAAKLVGLIERVARCDEGGLAELYDETSPIVYGIALQMLRSPHLAAELTREIYLEVWRQASRYDPSTGSVLAWVSAMAHHRAVHRVRWAGKEVGEQRTAPDAGEASGQVQDQAEGPEGTALAHAMSSLTEDERDAFTLTYLGGSRQSEVARLLGLPLTTVQSRIRSGLNGLRDALGVDP